MATKAKAVSQDETATNDSGFLPFEKLSNMRESARAKYQAVKLAVAVRRSLAEYQAESLAEPLREDTRAQGMMNRGIDLAVGVLVVGLLTAYLLPVAIDELVGVDTSSWGGPESSLFDLLPIFFVLAIALFVISKAQSAGK